MILTKRIPLTSFPPWSRFVQVCIGHLCRWRGGRRENFTARIFVGAVLPVGQNHPCADIFFKDDTGALYLVDVGGTGNMSKALKKVRRMNDVLVKEGLREDLQVSELKGVVNIRLENEAILSEAITDRGKSQNAAWWSPPNACLAAHRLKPKAGEANRRQQT